MEDVQIKSEPSIDSPKIEEVVTNHVCEVCSVSVPLHGMDVHISGKKHKSNLLKQNQNREAVDSKFLNLVFLIPCFILFFCRKCMQDM